MRHALAEGDRSCGSVDHASGQRKRGRNYPWDKERIAYAVQRYKDGAFASDIAAELLGKYPNDGRPSRNAVIGKISRSSDVMRSNKGNHPFTARRGKPISQRIQKINNATANEMNRSAPTPVNLTPLEPTNVVQLKDPTKEGARKLGPLHVKHSVASVTASHCHYPIGDPMQPGFSYCGRMTAPGKRGAPPYCADHRLLMYDPKASEGRDRELKMLGQKLPKRLRS